jgi:5-methylthioadenosine/S-adenosylhomocysteine deaminase
MATFVDTLIDAKNIVPIVPAQTTLSDHTVAINDGRIQAIVPTAEANTLYEARTRLSLPNHVLIPGLVNAHTHAAMTLMRGLADDLPLMRWLTEHIWPAEAAHVSAKFVYDGTLLACAEMLRSGVTCFNDMYFFPEAAARAALDAKMRAVLGMIVIEFPSAYAGDAETYLHRGLETRDQFLGQPLLKFCIAPHAPYTVSDKTFEKVLTYSEQLNVPIHIHVHETDDEITQSIASYNLRPLERLHGLGLLGPQFVAVHAVHLSASEISLLAQHNCHVVHCPTSNLKLASGIAPTAALLQAGVNVALGTDGAASNNRLDMFAEMRLAALLAKGASRQADILPAHQALAMATINGARALGMDEDIGSLEVGKAADIVAVDMSSIETSPGYDVASHLVYAASREHVSHVWVAGNLLIDNRVATHLDLDAIRLNTQSWRDTISPEKFQ